MDAKVCPDPVILGDATIKAVMAGATNLGDTMIKAATDVVNRTLSPQTTSAERCRKHFTSESQRGGSRLSYSCPEMIQPTVDVHRPHYHAKQADSGTEHISYPGFQAR